MTKALLQAIRAEYEHTDIGIEELCDKYSCTRKELKGYTTWEKGLNPQSKIRLVYEEVYQSPLELERTPEELHSDIQHTADDIIKGDIVSRDSIPVQLRDGFEGLRLLDTKLQSQALSLLNKIDEQINYVETAKDIRDLVASHTSIRDSYFNTQAPMINIINNTAEQSNSSALAQLLESTEADC